MPSATQERDQQTILRGWVRHALHALIEFGIKLSLLEVMESELGLVRALGQENRVSAVVEFHGAPALFVGQPDTERPKKMRGSLSSRCSECGGGVRRRTIAREFERQGQRVSVSGIRALVCEKCGEVYFEPGGAQALVEAVDRLFALAKRNRQLKGKLSAAVSWVTAASRFIR